MTHNGGAKAICLTKAIPGTPVRDDDAALVARARAGDAAAFEQLYHRHRDRVYTLCLNVCGQGEEARDLLQVTFIRAWRGLPGFRGDCAFTTWLHRIAVNTCREAGRRQPQVLEPPAAAPVPDAETADRVRATLLTLRPVYRVVLALRYSLALSYREIAERLNWSIPRVKVTLHRARRAFKDAYLRADEAPK